MTDVEALRRTLRQLTAVLVFVSVAALTFTATSVTRFAVHHGVPQGIAWMLDPMVGIALGAVLVFDGVLSEHGIRPGGWAAVLRWFAGGATWLMNVWDSVWPEGTGWGLPRHLDPAGVVLHSIPPVLLIVLAEAITRYRQAILARIRFVEAAAAVVNVPRSSTPPEPPAAASAEGPQSPPDEPPAPVRLSTADATQAIEQGWREGKSVRETAAVATRSSSYVGKVFQSLEAAHGPQPTPGQLALVPEAVAG